MKKITLYKKNESKIFYKFSDVRKFLFVAIPRIKKAIKTNTKINDWNVKMEKIEKDDTKKEYILYNKIMNKQRIFTSLEKISEYIQKDVKYIKSLLNDEIQDVFYEIDELVSA